MKSRTAEDESHHGGAPINGSKSIKKHKQMMMKKKNMRRLGGGGLSLEAFANAKSTTNNYNPALISIIFYIKTLALILLIGCCVFVMFQF